MQENENEEEMRLMVSERGSVKLSKKWGGVHHSVRFEIPNRDGVKLNDIMSGLKEGDNIYITIKRKEA